MNVDLIDTPVSAEHLPGVNWILNPHRLWDLPLAHSAPLGGGAADGLHLRTSYLRYKPSVAAVARLDLSATGHGNRVTAGGGPARSQVLWVATYSPQAGGKLEKLRITLQQLYGVAGQEMVATCQIPGRPGHVLAVGLPAADPKLVKGVHKVLGASAAGLGTAPSPWRVLRFNPQRRMVLAGGPGGSAPETVVKISAEAPAVSESTLAVLASDAVPIQVTTTAPGICPDPRVRCYPWYGDGDLTDHAVDTSTVEAARKAGRGLVRLHSCADRLAEKIVNRIPDSPDPVARMEVMATDLMAVDPDVAAQFRAVADRITVNLEITASLGTGTALRVLHGDFSADQVLVNSTAFSPGHSSSNPHSDDDGVMITDLDRMRLGQAADDLGNAVSSGIMTQLAQMAPSQDWEPVLDAVTAAMVEGYRDLCGAPSDHQIRTWAGFHLLMRVMTAFRDCSPHWPQRMHQVVQAAGALVPEAVPTTLTVQQPGGDLETFTVKRAWPKADGRLNAEVIDSTGRVRAAAATPNPHRLGLTEWKVNTFGSDHKLPGLKELSRHGQVVVHRRGRRAVVATADRYVKLLAADKVPETARLSHELHHLATAAGFAVPRVVSSGTDRVEFSVVAGQNLHSVGAAGQEENYAAGIRAWAHRWPNLVRADLASSTLPIYTAADEIRTLETWRQRLAAFPAASDVDPAAWADAVTKVQQMLADLPAGPSWRPGVLHRDLHEKQLLLDAVSGSIGLLDFDTAAIGDPALDLANLGVHLDLHSAQGVLSAQLHTVATRTVTEVACELAVTAHRMEAYRAATRARLVCVYAFRPQWKHLARTWAQDLIRDL